MMRLVKHGLMFGNLYEVSAPSMVARYNRALEHLTGKRTALEAFHVDISGFSPEIGDELDDIHYLNPHGCNRQFILLSIEQKTAPLLNARFSTSRSILKRFIEDNEDSSLRFRSAIASSVNWSTRSIPSPRRRTCFISGRSRWRRTPSAGIPKQVTNWPTRSKPS